ncbi:hypothetical protein BBJ28_00027165, partial [Nothophytophthora sp. Chile5]
MALRIATALLAPPRRLLATRACVSARRLSALSFLPQLQASIPPSLPAIHDLVADYEVPSSPRIVGMDVFVLLLTAAMALSVYYDYTLCHYTEELQHLIYAMARDYMVRLPCLQSPILVSHMYAKWTPQTDITDLCVATSQLDNQVQKLRYPEGVSVLQYDPSFAIRGLTIDKQKGLLCKISSHQKLSTTAVFRGRQRLSRDEIMELYEGSRHISVRDRDRNMEPLNDLFSVAHACLFA